VEEEAMEYHDDAREVRIHAISLGRPKRKSVKAAGAPRGGGTNTLGRALAVVGASASAAFDPPHQVWLATLGAAALSVRGLGSTWARLVAEGREVEAFVRKRLRPALDRIAPGRGARSNALGPHSDPAEA
jgi:hypothetical protein